MATFKFTYFLIKGITLSIECYFTILQRQLHGSCVLDSYLILLHVLAVPISHHLVGHWFTKTVKWREVSPYSLCEHGWLMLTANTCSSTKQKPKTEDTTTLTDTKCTTGCCHLRITFCNNNCRTSLIGNAFTVYDHWKI